MEWLPSFAIYLEKKNFCRFSDLLGSMSSLRAPVNSVVSDYGLLTKGMKPLPEPVLTYCK